MEKAVHYPSDVHEVLDQVEEKSFWFQHRMAVTTFFIKKNVKNLNFVDLGGGNGALVQHLQQEGLQAKLVEASPDALRIAKKRNVRNIICQSIQEYVSSPEKIENSGLFDVLEHIKEDGPLLKALSEKIEDSSYVFVTVPAYQFLWSDSDLLAHHFRRYSRKSITKALKENGFEVVHCTFLFSYLILPVFLLRTLPYRLGKRQNKIDASDYQKDGLVDFVLKRLSRIEFYFISKGWTLPFGTSLFVIAKKITHSSYGEEQGSVGQNSTDERSSTD